MKLLNRRREKRHGRRFWKVLSVKGRLYRKLCISELMRHAGEWRRREIYRRHMKRNGQE